MTSESFCLTFEDHVKKRHPDFFYASVYVSASLCLCQPASLSVYVSASLRLRPPVPLPVCVPASLHPQHCSAPSLISPIVIPLIRFCLFFSLVLFFPFFPYLIFSFLFFLFFTFFFTFSSSLIFSLPILLTLLVLPRHTLFSPKVCIANRFPDIGQLSLPRHTFFCQKPCIANKLCEIATYPMQRHPLLS